MGTGGGDGERPVDDDDEAEVEALRAIALGGDLMAAYSLAGQLDRQGRHQEAISWYTVVAESSSPSAHYAAHRMNHLRVDLYARQLSQQGRRPELWRIMMSATIVEAIALAVHLDDWAPAGEAARAVAERLRADGIGAIATAVARRAVVRSTRLLPYTLDGPPSAEATDEGVVALAVSDLRREVLRQTTGPDLERRLITVAPDGTVMSIYAGPRAHLSLACLGADTLLAIRNASESDASGTLHIRWNLVRYDPGGELVLADGVGLPTPRLVATRHGYIAGLRLTSEVLRGSLVDPPEVVDLARFELTHRTRELAVDPNGDQVAFGDDHLLVVVDATLERRIAAAASPERFHGPLLDLTFAGPEAVITSGERGLCLWTLQDGVLQPVMVAETPAPLHDLFSVPSWGLVGGRSPGGVTYFDPETLAPLIPPRDVVGEGTPFGTHYAHAAPGGRFVVYGGEPRLVIGGDAPDHPMTGIHDLHHPLNWVNRPLGLISRTDVDQIAAVLGSPDGRLQADERHLLRLVCDSATHRLAGHLKG
jgi:hypothetical protein